MDIHIKRIVMPLFYLLTALTFINNLPTIINLGLTSWVFQGVIGLVICYVIGWVFVEE